MAEPQGPNERIRPPMQLRSRQAWERILEAGTHILEKEGRDAFTIAAVCERAGVAPTAIYRRVDGISGLFWAIYDHGLAGVIATYERGLAKAAALPIASDERLVAVVRAVGDTFEENIDFLHPIINYTADDTALRDRSSVESLVFVDRLTDLLSRGDLVRARDVARMLHQECIFRAMYGNAWLSHEPEGYEEFLARLLRVSRGAIEG